MDIVITNIRKRLLWISQHSVRFAAPGIDVELECRMIIPEVYFNTWDDINIQYYRSEMYPTLSIRTYNDIIDTKETVYKEHIDNITVSISIEKKYSTLDEIGRLLPDIKRILKRITLSTNPYVTITHNINGGYMLEIEYDESTIDNCIDILKQNTLKYWPPPKPLDGYPSTFISNIINNEYYITPKADGEHCIMYIYKDGTFCGITHSGRKAFIHDNIKHISNNLIENNLDYVLEGELITDTMFLYFDIICVNNKDIRHFKLQKRLSMCNIQTIHNISIIKKPIYPCKNFSQLKQSYNIVIQKHPYNTDGIIICPSNYTNHTYKSKPIPTVDMQYFDNKLYLANERYSTKEPSDSFPYENWKIYELTMDFTCIRERKDKITPNYRMPVNYDVMSRIVSGEGVHSLRYFHNRNKLFMLKLLPKDSVLLDVGSATGGDIDKWLYCKFKLIYAVDPNINLRTNNKSIISIKSLLHEIPNNVSYDALSILYVPWDDIFLHYMIKAKHVLLILMDNAYTIRSKYANVECIGKSVNINFDHTTTAKIIDEKIPNTNNIIIFMKNHGYYVDILKYNMVFGTDIEIKISRMYTYYHFYTKF